MSTTAIVDQLGMVKAQIAELTRTETKLKERLVAIGIGAHDGNIFRATVSASDRETLDMDAVRAKLSPQFISAHTRVTPVITVKVVARVKA